MAIVPLSELIDGATRLYAVLDAQPSPLKLAVGAFCSYNRTPFFASHAKIFGWLGYWPVPFIRSGDEKYTTEPSPFGARF